MNDTNGGTIISYQRIPASRSYEVSQVLLNSFFKEEPLGLMLGLQTEQVSRWIPKYIESAIEQNVSVMAVATAASPSEDDEQSHQETIVGVCVNISDSLDILNFIDKNLEPNMWHVGQFLHQLEESILSNPGTNKQTIQCLFLNVLSGYAGRGIAKTLVLKAEELARNSGFECLQVETTSEFSYKVYKTLGYTQIGELKFEDFKDEEGQPLIPNVDSIHTCGRVMWKLL